MIWTRQKAITIANTQESDRQTTHKHNSSAQSYNLHKMGRNTIKFSLLSAVKVPWPMGFPRNIVMLSKQTGQKDAKQKQLLPKQRVELFIIPTIIL